MFGHLLHKSKTQNLNESITQIYEATIKTVLQASKNPKQIHAHIRFYIDIDVLPMGTDSTSLIKRMSSAIAADVDDHDLFHRMILQPMDIIKLIEPIMAFAEVPPVHVWTVLALATGHHLQEAFTFSFRQLCEESGLLSFPPFKRRKSESLEEPYQINCDDLHLC